MVVHRWTFPDMIAVASRRATEAASRTDLLKVRLRPRSAHIAYSLRCAVLVMHFLPDDGHSSVLASISARLRLGAASSCTWTCAATRLARFSLLAAWAATQLALGMEERMSRTKLRDLVLSYALRDRRAYARGR